MLEGVTLAERLDDASWSLTDRLTVVRRLCAPLAYIHGEGIVHRDLKPENILLREGDQPVLVDFGLVERPGFDEGRETLSWTSEIAGTVPYMSPEQCRGDRVDARSDLYSMGCVLYE